MKVLVIVILMGVGIYKFLKDPVIKVGATGIEFSYEVKYPGGASRGDRLPMVIALHGNGDTASNFYKTALDLLDGPCRLVLVTGPFGKVRGSSWPWTEADFKKYGKPFSDFVNILASKYKTKNKPILYGFSGGGMMAYHQAFFYHENYSVIFPISGNFRVSLPKGEAEYPPEVKVIAFHGTTDSVVNFGSGKAAIKSLKDRGFNAEFISFKGGHHGVFLKDKIEMMNRLVDEMDLLE